MTEWINEDCELKPYQTEALKKMKDNLDKYGIPTYPCTPKSFQEMQNDVLSYATTKVSMNDIPINDFMRIQQDNQGNIIITKEEHEKMTTNPQFKVWSHDENKFLDDNDENRIFIDSKNTVYMYHEFDGHSKDDEAQPYRLQNVEICRFGFYDDSQKPLYFNDIVEISHPTHHKEIRLVDNTLAYDIRELWECGYIVKHLGNRFKNPELIGGGV